ncbi:hypothetical protein [Halohasta salina]|uniref:hypothetical protein n=1 Tax=Halohasta salina TaxID=2961621 RepID=UPI0020A2C40A|nr:hypothetical protein [Halohasta salina]
MSNGGLLIDAELTVDLAGTTLRLHTEDDTLYVEAPDFAALRELRATTDSDAVASLRALGVEGPLAVATPVLVRVRGVPVARYDPSLGGGWLADRLGIDPFRVDLAGVLQAAIRRR